MNILEDLYYGNISPHERYIKQGSKVEKKHLRSSKMLPVNFPVLPNARLSQQVLSLRRES